MILRLEWYKIVIHYYFENHEIYMTLLEQTFVTATKRKRVNEILSIINEGSDEISEIPKPINDSQVKN